MTDKLEMLKTSLLRDIAADGGAASKHCRCRGIVANAARALADRYVMLPRIASGCGNTWEDK